MATMTLISHPPLTYSKKVGWCTTSQNCTITSPRSFPGFLEFGFSTLKCRGCSMSLAVHSTCPMKSCAETLFQSMTSIMRGQAMLPRLSLATGTSSMFQVGSFEFLTTSVFATSSNAPSPLCLFNTRYLSPLPIQSFDASFAPANLILKRSPLALDTSSAMIFMLPYRFSSAPFVLDSGLIRHDPLAPTIPPIVVDRDPRKSWSSSLAEAPSMSYTRNCMSCTSSKR
mmetsp:Transcript_31383/g.78963  ORF Transcript_31383/g.78963 Transcript_31383/m.78963 type:complete len:227 (+) Transcript_31383:817-1497(+)